MLVYKECKTRQLFCIFKKNIVLFALSLFITSTAHAIPNATQESAALREVASILGLLPKVAPDQQLQIKNPNRQHKKHNQPPLRNTTQAPLTHAQRQLQARRIHEQRKQANIKRRQLALQKHNALINKRHHNPRAKQTHRDHVAHQHRPVVGNVWHRIYRNYRIPHQGRRSIIERNIRRLQRNPDYLERVTFRSRDYLYMVVNELNRRRMPTELALLPFVESAYKNTAYSFARAAGMWQFIPSTGRNFGLVQTRSYDARLDAYQATRAALDYLQNLNKQFKGDWLLTLAAYNAGEARVHREIRKNLRRGKPTTFWHLSLPRETRNYVPKLLAYKEVFSKPAHYRIRHPYAPNKPLLTSLNINKTIDLRQVALNAGLPKNTLTSLNPSYLHGITTPKYSTRIILPREHTHRINNAIHRTPASRNVYHKTSAFYIRNTKKRRRYLTHRVRKGESLYLIARKHGTTVKRLKRLNRLKSNRIIPGTRLKVAGKYKRYKKT